jgi:hypothetical protein
VLALLLTLDGGVAASLFPHGRKKEDKLIWLTFFCWNCLLSGSPEGVTLRFLDFSMDVDAGNATGSLVNDVMALIAFFSVNSTTCSCFSVSS